MYQLMTSDDRGNELLRRDAIVALECGNCGAQAKYVFARRNTLDVTPEPIGAYCTVLCAERRLRYYARRALAAAPRRTARAGA